MADPKQIAELVAALMLEHEALLFRVGVTTSDPEAMVYSEDGKPVRKVKDITSPARKAADLLEALAAENAALKARLAEVGAIADRQLELSGNAYHDMKTRAEAAEAERDRLAAELAALTKGTPA